MLTLRLQNITGSVFELEEGVRDYKYSVDVNGKEIAFGVVRHTRKDGWAKLVAMVAAQEYQPKRPRRVRVRTPKTEAVPVG